MSEAERLEKLWAGEFGAKYAKRNKPDLTLRSKFWDSLIARIHPSNILEVGCNAGANLHCIDTPLLQGGNVYGVDVNMEALSEFGFNAIYGQAQDIPFKDGFFDLVFTCGVLIHQPEESLLKVMSEIVRCSRKYVLCMEYFSEKREEVPYRDQPGSLWKDEYAKLYIKHFNLVPLEKGFLTKADGFDDITWVLLRLPQ